MGVWREVAGKQAPCRATAGRSCQVSGELQEVLENQSETMLENRREWAIPIHILKTRNIAPNREPEVAGGNQCRSFCFSNGSRGKTGCRDLLGGCSNISSNTDTPLWAVCQTGTHLWLHMCYETKLQQHWLPHPPTSGHHLAMSLLIQPPKSGGPIQIASWEWSVVCVDSWPTPGNWLVYVKWLRPKTMPKITTTI